MSRQNLFCDHAFCHRCGRAYKQRVWPRQCAHCKSIHFQNPLPVAALIAHDRSGNVIIVTRKDNNGLALPGGFHEMDETWQECAVREFRDETGIECAASSVEHVATITSPTNRLIVFGCASLPDKYTIKVNTRELVDVQLMDPHEVVDQLCFDVHQQALAAFL